MGRPRSRAKTEEATEAVRAYLAAVADPSPDEGYLATLRGKLAQTDDPIERLLLRRELERAQLPRTVETESGFVHHAGAWAQANGISAEAFLVSGVEELVLRRAGVLPRRGRRPG